MHQNWHIPSRYFFKVCIGLLPTVLSIYLSVFPAYLLQDEVMISAEFLVYNGSWNFLAEQKQVAERSWKGLLAGSTFPGED